MNATKEEIYKMLQGYLDDSRGNWQSLSTKQQLEREQKRRQTQSQDYYKKRQEAISRATWVCELCGEAQEPSIVKDPYTGRQLVSRQKVCTCPAAVAAFESILRDEQAERDKLHLSWLLSSAKWCEFDTEWPTLEAAKQQLREARQLVYDSYLDGRTGILLAGPVGCGKSHLARSVYGAYGKQGKRVQFYTEPQIVKALSSKDNTSNSIERLCMAADFLIFDDIGAESFNGQSEWLLYKLQSFYFTIFEHRGNEGKKTFITTNLTSKLIKDHCGRRAASRINGILKVRGNAVSMWDVPDYRAKDMV